MLIFAGFKVYFYILSINIIKEVKIYMEQTNLNYVGYECTAYHGNKQHNIDKFIAQGKFDVSISGQNWLGTGVYFFENDLKQAVDWCKLARDYYRWSVIEAIIKAEKIINLIDTKNYNTFIELLQEIRKNKKVLNKLKRSYEIKNRVRVKDHFLNSLVLDLMYDHEPYELVKHAFRVPGRMEEEGTNIVAIQIQICVKDQNCIVNFKEVDDGELSRL